MVQGTDFSPVFVLISNIYDNYQNFNQRILSLAAIYETRNQDSRKFNLFGVNSSLFALLSEA